MHRRAFVRAAGVALLAAAPRALRARRPRRKLDRLGLQLYTVRHDLARDFEGTIARVAEIGYREVEFAGYFGKSPRAVRAILERHGLVAPAAHLPIETLRGEWRRALEDAHVLGHAYVVVAWIPADQRRTLGDYRRLAELFNRAGEQATAAGMRFAYHNQDYEFASLAGRIPYDVLLAATDPRHVALELDLYWITKGGADPLTYFARYPGRFPLVHVKDMDGTPARNMTDVGRGVIDFPRIFDAGARGGIQHYFVEHDHPADSFASVRASYAYLRQLEF